jgi:hypothetical protein
MTGEYRLLILGGHESYHSTGFGLYCRENSFPDFHTAIQESMICWKNPGIPLPFRIQTVSLKVLDLKFKVLDTII